jgi:hypothetical protein
MAVDAKKLIALEKQFGGKYTVQKRSRSSLYRGLDENFYSATHTGGDRMLDHGYAKHYAKVLPENPNTIVEMGILRGTGLALWSILYPDARIVGLDIDVSHFADNFDNLLGLGAFPGKPPEVIQFDELCMDSWDDLKVVLPAGSVDLWIDDAMHDTNSVVYAAKRARRYMARGGVYVIEDNEDAFASLQADFANKIYQSGRFTAVFYD